MRSFVVDDEVFSEVEVFELILDVMLLIVVQSLNEILRLFVHYLLLDKFLDLIEVRWSVFVFYWRWIRRTRASIRIFLFWCRFQLCYRDHRLDFHDRR